MSDFKLGLESATPQHQRHPRWGGRWHRQKDKNRSPSAKNQTGAWYFTSAHNSDTILNINYLTRTRNIASLPYKIVFGRFYAASFQEIILSSGVFRRERRAVFILGAMWNALVRGWRSDCVVGGMETRFQWRKAHSRTAKCEAFHFAPRLFFMFLFLIPFTIRQQCIIYPQEFSTEPGFSVVCGGYLGVGGVICLFLFVSLWV